jgi:two-component system, cell cycle response regulator DivK
MMFAPPSLSVSHIRILLIEDDEVSCQLMTDYLEYCGWQVFGLAQGKKFDAGITQFQPHVILLDLKLSDIDGIDGFTILKRMQASAEWRNIPVIVVSACAFPSDQQRALALGARQYLVKPVQLVQLTQAIHQALENSAA